MDEVDEVGVVDEVDKVDEVDEVDLTVDLTSESVEVSRGQLRSISLSLAIHQTAGNTKSYMWDGWDGIGSLKVSPTRPLELRIFLGGGFTKIQLK